MTTVSTNLGNTRERAGQLRYEPNGTNPATNVQDAIGNMLYPLTVPTTVTGTQTLSNSDIVVLVNPSAPLTVNLPNPIDWQARNSKYGVPLTVFDISGNAATHNITVSGDGVTIDGAASVVISDNYAGFRFMPFVNDLGAGKWVLV